MAFESAVRALAVAEPDEQRARGVRRRCAIHHERLGREEGGDGVSALTPRQRHVLERMRDGWTLAVDRGVLSPPPRPCENVSRRTVDSLLCLGWIRVIPPWLGHLTPAGREAVTE